MTRPAEDPIEPNSEFSESLEDVEVQPDQNKTLYEVPNSLSDADKRYVERDVWDVKPSEETLQNYTLWAAKYRKEQQTQLEMHRGEQLTKLEMYKEERKTKLVMELITKLIKLLSWCLASIFLLMIMAAIIPGVDKSFVEHILMLAFSAIAPLGTLLGVTVGYYFRGKNNEE